MSAWTHLEAEENPHIWGSQYVLSPTHFQQKLCVFAGQCAYSVFWSVVQYRQIESLGSEYVRSLLNLKNAPQDEFRMTFYFFVLLETAHLCLSFYIVLQRNTCQPQIFTLRILPSNVSSRFPLPPHCPARRAEAAATETHPGRRAERWSRGRCSRSTSWSSADWRSSWSVNEMQRIFEIFNNFLCLYKKWQTFRPKRFRQPRTLQV